MLELMLHNTPFFSIQEFWAALDEGLPTPLSMKHRMHIPTLHDIHLDMAGAAETGNVAGLGAGGAGSEGAAGSGNKGTIDTELGRNGGSERASLCSPIDDFLVGAEVGGAVH